MFEGVLLMTTISANLDCNNFLSFMNSSDGVIFIKKVQKSLTDHGFVIMKGINKNIQNLFDIAPFLNCRVYESERLGNSHAFEVNPFSTELSETINNGGFHTDFSTAKLPPKFVALQCIDIDPRHPFYGRNQVVSFLSIRKRFFELYPMYNDDFFENIYIQHIYNGYEKSIKFLSNYNNNFILRYHSKLMSHSSNEMKIDNIYIGDLINTISTEVCNDFVLDEGDIFLFDNWSSLHKRGECTTIFKGYWGGRFVNSVRYEFIPPA